MARRRTRSHLELREQVDAAERRKTDEEDTDEEGEEEEDEDEGEEEEGEEATAEGGEEGSGGDDDDEEEAPKKKKKKKAPPKEPKPKRTRAPKVVRQKVVWAVFNNSNQRIATYEYPKHQDAIDHATRLQSEKKQTFFVQPVKEPIEEKKEKD